MKHLKLFFALFAMLALGVGNAWGAEATINFSEKGLENGVQYLDPFTIDANTTITFAGGDNDGKYYNTGTGIRTYANGTITIECANGTISDISFTWAGSSYKPAADVATPAGYSTSTGNWTGSTSSVTLTRPSGSGHWRLQKVTVTYETAGGSVTPDLDPTTYTIKWHTAKGVTTDVTLNEGATITKLATVPEMTGYEFMGWTASCDVASNGSDFTALTDFGTADSDKDFYAVFAVATTTGGGGTTTETLKGSDVTYSSTSSGYQSFTATTASGTWTGTANYNTQGYIQINKNSKNYHIGSPTFASNVTSIKITTTNNSAANRTFYICSSNSTAQPSSGNLGSYKTTVANESFTIDLTTDAKQFYIYSSGAVYISQIDVTYSGGGGTITYDNYITTCASGIEYVELGDDFKWSATEAEVTIDATDNVFPTLKNEHNVPVKYSSSDDATATIAADGAVTLKKDGTVTITAKYEGGTAAGTGKEYKAKSVDYTLTVKPAPLEPIAGGVIDILDNDWSGLTTSDYVTVAAKTAANTGHSNAQYTAQCAGSNSSIQLRSNNSNSGIVSTVSGGLVKRVEIEWNDATSTDRTLNIYGSNTPYTNPTDLYDTNKDGDKLGTIVKGTSTYLEISEDYRYIGLRSASSAMYLAKVTITWLPINSKVTVDREIANGSIGVSGAADLNAVAAGTELTLSNTPATGYKLTAYDVYKTGEETTKVTETDGKFIMPEFDVTISATFEQLKELDKIEVNTTNVKTTFWQGETFNSTGLVVTAYYTDETYTIVTPKSITGSTAEAGTKKVTVSYTEGDITKETKYDITVKAIANNEETPYTVIEAREIIDAVGETTVDVYVQGIVSKIVTAFNPTYGNISYDISDDGLKTSDQLQAYRGFSYDGAGFTSADDIQVGDVVVVKGKLKIYNTTYELDEGNQLVSLVRSTEPKPTAATLPFEFDGNKDDIADVVGMSHEGLGNYSTSPKLKFDDENDNVIIHFDSEPGEFSFALKQNGQNAGTFTVYESANGEDYTSIWSGGDLGGTGKSATIKPTLSATARYVKFEYTTKGASTNYGLGSISIAKPDNRSDAELAWNPTSVTLTQGEAFTAPTLNKPNSVSDITYESSNDEVATVTTAGVIALGSATGTATITATFDGDETYKPATATCTITVNKYIEAISGTWELVTDASKLQAGMEIIIASVAEAGAVKTMGEQGNNNRSAVASTVDGDKLNPAVGTTVITLEDCQLYEGLFALKTKDGYLYAASSSSNHLKSQEGINKNACWTITITEGVAAVVATNSSNHNIMRYNKNSDLFSCYVSGQQDIALYAKKPAHTRTTSAGRYGTICLPGNIVKCLGATLYEVAGKEGEKVIFDEVTTPEAGMPYIFLAHNAEVLFYCGDQTAAAGNHNSLHGTFTVLQNTELEGKYMVQNNKIVKCNPANSGVAAYRAYFNGTELEALGSAPAPMPGRRRITMGTESENTATGTEDVIAPEGQTIKLIENGQLIIIRNGEKFNAQGQKL